MGYVQGRFKPIFEIVRYSYKKKQEGFELGSLLAFFVLLL